MDSPPNCPVLDLEAFLLLVDDFVRCELERVSTLAQESREISSKYHVVQQLHSSLADLRLYCPKQASRTALDEMRASIERDVEMCRAAENRMNVERKSLIKDQEGLHKIIRELEKLASSMKRDLRLSAVDEPRPYNECNDFLTNISPQKSHDDCMET